jgi:glyoxylase-like metal-dependent hydrolase (beta-lactamase superfamily II)
VAVADEPGVCTALRAAGVDPATVTDVVITHLHFDHAGGVTRRGPDGPVLTFPKARHHVQRANLETASAPNEREKASYLARTVGPLAGAQLHLVDGAAELLPGHLRRAFQTDARPGFEPFGSARETGP